MLSPRHLPLLATFVQLCREGSFTKAASALSISKSLVSTHLRQLEAALGARLVQRTTRRLSLTQVGQQVLEAADRMLSAASEVSRIAEAKQDVPSGVLRVAAPVDLGALLVAPAVARLCSRFPELRAELVLSDAATDPIAHRLDALLSVNVPKDSGMVSTQLGTDIEVIVAAPALAKKWQGASQPKDLAGASWVSHPSIPPSARHQFRNQRGTVQRMPPMTARIVANTGDAIRSLVVGGAGFAVVPSQMVAEDVRTGRMVRVRFFLEELRAMFRLSGFEAQYAGGAPRHALRYPNASA